MEKPWSMPSYSIESSDSAPLPSQVEEGGRRRCSGLKWAELGRHHFVYLLCARILAKMALFHLTT
ncbi:unnamed protein product, partial [Ilex paraguariensis]